jgi:hypothetical protein
MNVSTMKSAVTKFLVSVADPCLGRFNPLSILFSIATLIVVSFFTAVVCKTLVGPFAWRRRRRLP